MCRLPPSSLSGMIDSFIRHNNLLLRRYYQVSKFIPEPAVERGICRHALDSVVEGIGSADRRELRAHSDA